MDVRMADAPSPAVDALAHDHGLVDAHDFNNLLSRFDVLTANHAALNVNVTKLTELVNILLKSQVTGSISREDVQPRTDVSPSLTPAMPEGVSHPGFLYS